MVTGIEAAGIALAAFPLVVNQLDNYAQGLDKIKVLWRYRRHLANYMLEIRTQQSIFVNYLEQALEDVVGDEDRLSDLITNLPGKALAENPWKNQDLQIRLQAKLGRNYELFIGNMSRVHELLETIAEKLNVDILKPSHKEATDYRLRTILSKATLDDLLQKVTSVNGILKILIDQSAHREATQSRKKRNRWNKSLLLRYNQARKHAEGLFGAILQGGCWKCRCKDHHTVHFQLQCHPAWHNRGSKDTEHDLKLRVLFSNTQAQAQKSTIWSWREVEFEPAEEVIILAHHSITEQRENTRGKEQRRGKVNGKKAVCFDVTDTVLNIKSSSSDSAGCGAKTINTEPAINKGTAGLIGDFCSVLCTPVYVNDREMMGFISHATNSNVRYFAHAIKCSRQSIPELSLCDILSKMSRRERLHIAAALACALIQYYGNWLKPSWESSDVLLAADRDGHTALLDNLYLSWPLSGQPSSIADDDVKSCPHVQNDILFPLALTLIELSVGETIGTVQIPEDGDRNRQTTKFNAACRLIKEVQRHSGAAYAEVVHTCLFWSGVGSCFGDGRFEERVFNTIISPLVEDLAYFEGVRAM